MSGGGSSSNPVVVSASGKHTATLIFLYGLGDTGHGWASSLAEIRQDHVKIICPTAPVTSVTLNHGKVQLLSPYVSQRSSSYFQTNVVVVGFQMPAWFDLMSLDPSGPEDEKGIEKSNANLTKIIDEEINNGIDPSRIVIGGFSQGGALAIYMGLTGKHTV